MWCCWLQLYCQAHLDDSETCDVITLVFIWLDVCADTLRHTQTHSDVTTQLCGLQQLTQWWMRTHQKLCCGWSVLSRRCRWERKWPGTTGDCRRPGQSGSCGQNQYQMDWTGLYWTGEHRDWLHIQHIGSAQSTQASVWHNPSYNVAFTGQNTLLTVSLINQRRQTLSTFVFRLDMKWAKTLFFCLFRLNTSCTHEQWLTHHMCVMSGQNTKQWLKTRWRMLLTSRVVLDIWHWTAVCLSEALCESTV